MNELTKTFIFVFLAAAMIAGAVLSRPTVPEFKMEEMVGKPLFPKFTDPLGIKTLEIVKLNANGDRTDFRIAEVNGIWSIPSHENYPADAKDQMGKVAEALFGLKVLEVIEGNESDTATFQTQYGVVDPASENISDGGGVGIKVALGGKDNEQLVNLIIGKELAATPKTDMMGDEGGAALRYVRVAGQPPIYVVSVDPNRFPTNFDQWIEKNLLDISTLDIKEIFVDEYSFKVEVELTNSGLQETLSPNFSGDFTLSYNASAIGAEKWSLAKRMKFGSNYKYSEQPLETGKELNTETLENMVSALNDLKIVSVLKKPAALAAALRESEPFKKMPADSSMQKTGFYLVELPDLKRDAKKSHLQLLSNEGDIQLRMKNGVIYNLRFGDLTGTESEVSDEKSDAEKTAGTVPVMGVNRYLFITAEFDSAIIPPPELKTVPEIPAEGEQETLEKLKAEKETAEKANQREKERYDADIETGKKRAAELSSRFADWYYVIPEDVYKKIHLTETNVFQAKTPAAEEPAAETKPEPSIPELPDLPGTETLKN